jgi:hypothetical protein
MSESMERTPRPPLLDENDRPGPPPIMSEEPRRSSKGLTLFIAGFALVAFGGIVWYAYDQGRRTGSEETAPLIRADTAPVRVRPDQPGGLKVPHQDKLIFEKLTDGASTEARPAERLLPRPEQPAAAPRTTSTPETVPPARKPTTVAEVPIPKRPPAPATQSGPKATSRAAGAPRVLLPPKQPSAAAAIPSAPKPAQAPKPPVVAKKAPVLKTSPTKAPSRTAGASTIKPVPGGRFRIQIAAFKNEGAARSAWERVQKANKAELGALGLTIERINISGKGTFFRVQGGPVDEARARAICRALDSRKQACIVVRR